MQAGGKVIFECKIAANPKPILTWYRDDTQLSEGGRYSIIDSYKYQGLKAISMKREFLKVVMSGYLE